MRLTAFNGPSPKIPIQTQKSRRYLIHRPSYSFFVQNFVAMAMKGRSGKMQLAAFDGASPKTPLYAQKSRKNLLRKPSYSQFCPKFRCHGNGVSQGKCNWQHSMAHPRKRPNRRKNLTKISYASQVIANFVPNFVAMATREGPG